MRAAVAAVFWAVCAPAGAWAAAQQEGPEAFLQAIYARYAADPDFFVGQDDLLPPAVYAPSLLRLMQRNEAFHKRNGTPGMDGDPLCDCQEHASMTAPRIAVRMTGRETAEARVGFTVEGTFYRDLKLRLVKTPAGWRVDDVGSADTPSLRKWLAADAQARK